MIEQERHLMIQEVYQSDPWKMLICCICLNQTSRDQLDRVRIKFFERYPDAKSVINCDPWEMSEIIKSLGFKNRRTLSIINFSKDWIEKSWNSPIELYGIGKYGQDSWEIFQNGNLDVKPTDGALVSYLNQVKSSNNLSI